MKPIIVIDTREKEEFSFHGERVAIIRRALPAGDYSLEGFEDRIAVERKTLDDFVNTVIRGRERFRRELQKLTGYESACVVVEADLADVVSRDYHAGVHPASVLGALSSILVDYGIPVFFCSNRQVACLFTECYLLRFYRKVHSVCEAP